MQSYAVSTATDNTDTSHTVFCDDWWMNVISELLPFPKTFRTGWIIAKHHAEPESMDISLLVDCSLDINRYMWWSELCVLGWLFRIARVMNPNATLVCYKLFQVARISSTRGRVISLKS